MAALLPGLAVFVGGSEGLRQALTRLQGSRPLEHNPFVDAVAK